MNFIFSSNYGGCAFWSPLLSINGSRLHGGRSTTFPLFSPLINAFHKTLILIIATPFHLPLYIDNVTIQLYRPTHHRRRHIPSFEKYFYLKKRGESNFFTFLIQINLFFSFKKWLNMESWTLDSVVLLLENGAKGDENRQDSISAESQWILTGLSTLVNLKNSVPYIFVRLAKLAATMTGSSNGEIPRRRIVYLSSSSKV